MYIYIYIYEPFRYCIPPTRQTRQDRRPDSGEPGAAYLEIQSSPTEKLGRVRRRMPGKSYGILWRIRVIIGCRSTKEQLFQSISKI